jgi:hypothetical protein
MVKIDRAVGRYVLPSAFRSPLAPWLYVIALHFRDVELLSTLQANAFLLFVDLLLHRIRKLSDSEILFVPGKNV